MVMAGNTANCWPESLLERLVGKGSRMKRSPRVSGSTASSVVEQEAMERDITPAAFTNMKLTDEEAASLDAWFDRAVPHPAHPRDALPRRGESEPGKRLG